MALFATTAELGDFLGEELTGSRLTQAAMVLELVTADIQAWTGQTLALVVDDVITMTGTDDWELELPERPVVAVGDITLDGSAVDPSSFHRSDSSLVRVGGWLGPTASLVEITYTHGYNPIPEAVRGATLQLAARMMANPQGVRQESVGTYSVTYAGELGGDGMPAALRRYRRSGASPVVRSGWQRPPYWPLVNNT